MARSSGGEDNDEGCAGDPDRRKFLRVELNRRVLLRLSKDLTFSGTAQNISHDAVRILCPLRYALLIHPAGEDAAPNLERVVEISVALPDKEALGDFKARCRLKYCVRYDDRHLALGLQFIETDSQSIQRLDRFLQASSGSHADRSISH